jgi:hypothetical protein
MKLFGSLYMFRWFSNLCALDKMLKPIAVTASTAADVVKASAGEFEDADLCDGFGNSINGPAAQLKNRRYER